ncbi:GvpL/GvpF family gas vesicle protein [Candidatus Oleimmundimicrobium sp.]|uniref:GvpL/GvpF family gas vesicle protein n=1 Tax=Candidatus Oleimmundimicrobium sp. TaxID=3060597 RepID=UPI00271D8EDB|nr:GvpL/GvpF family gas vesicle protein [Candidatus Oleimmundimicrobium sp.]MDO8885534.1 GvpL/GvpF family gas vesicle protein [Candidatus Oleimmundimicrobium sp.]
MGEGRYLYCVANDNQKVSLGKIGIEGNEVYTIPYKNLCAVVHNCPAEPYESEDSERVRNWVIAHERVVELAWGKFGVVLPLSFDTIIKGEEGSDPEKNIKNWLKEDYENLKEKMTKVRGKAEYGVQIFWDPKIIADKIAQTNEEIKKLDREIKSKPEGAAYMYKHKLENLLKRDIEKEADRCFKDLYERVKNCVDDIRVEKTKKEKGKQMLMNLSCLLPLDASKKLGEELERIDKMEEFSVHFTGPWPPYSFT